MRLGSRALVYSTIVAGPVALGVETLLRKSLFPPDFEELRSLLGPKVTPIAWALCGVAVVTIALGVALHDRIVAQQLRRTPPGIDPEVARARASLGAFLLAATIPQLPAIFATFTFMVGAPLLPVLVCIGISTIGVFIQGVRFK